MKVVIAGSNGLVGNALMKAFIANGDEVIGLNRQVVNLLDLDATKKCLEKIRPQVVIDAAAKVGGIGANDAFPVEFLSNNIQIQNNLMESAFEADVAKFIFLGSGCIYPRDCDQPIKEEYLMTGPLESTNSAYAIAKIAGIELINSYRKEYGLNWISLMPTNLYGPADNFNLKSSHVFPALVRRFIEASENGVRQVTLWGTGTPRREFLHVSDLAQAVIVANQNYDSSQHLNVGSGSDIQIKVLAEKIAEASGYNGEIAWDTSQPDGTPQRVLDVTRIKALGWAPKISLDSGIKSTVEWYRSASMMGDLRK